MDHLRPQDCRLDDPPPGARSADWIGDQPKLEQWNRKAEERRQEKLKEGKTPGPEIEIEG